MSFAKKCTLKMGILERARYVPLDDISPRAKTQLPDRENYSSPVYTGKNTAVGLVYENGRIAPLRMMDLRCLRIHTDRITTRLGAA